MEMQTWGMFGPITNRHWHVDITAFRLFSEKAAELADIIPAIMRSAQPNPQWLADHTRFEASLTQQALQHQQAIFKRMQQISRTQSEISDMIVDGYYKRSRTMDRIFENYSQAVRGVETYKNPSRDLRPVELPAGYDQTWTDGTEYILTNDPRFDPSQMQRGHWTRMEKMER